MDEHASSNTRTRHLLRIGCPLSKQMSCLSGGDERRILGKHNQTPVAPRATNARRARGGRGWTLEIRQNKGVDSNGTGWPGLNYRRTKLGWERSRWSMDARWTVVEGPSRMVGLGLAPQQSIMLPRDNKHTWTMSSFFWSILPCDHLLV